MRSYLGWYAARDEPGLFRDVLPAWSDENLRSLASQIETPLFMAHVRAATDTVTARNNCHPFSHGPLLFMHNGQIGGYLKLRRQLENMLSEDLFSARRGSTDSEVLFLLLLQMGIEADFQGAVVALVSAIKEMAMAQGICEPFRFTPAYADGASLKAVRFASDERAPTLYYQHSGSNCLVVSEPLTEQPAQWQLVPQCHVLCVDNDGVEVLPLSVSGW